ncbi:MAG: hypothetical protein KAI17_04730 [Thiotrichaceae bacterium]|nr:hypothetical protein [Thiotrichaceae bacterium]
MRHNNLLFWCGLFISSLATAEDWTFGGHLKYQLEKSNIDNQYLNFRLTTEKRWGAWDVQIHYEVLTSYGDSKNTTVHNHRLFNFMEEFENIEKFDTVQRLDRFFVGYNGEQLVIRLGQQAVTWGNGLIFHPLDIFNPFSPTAIDKDYKTGDDMVYGQWLFDSGDDLQMIFLPYSNPDTNHVENTQSSFALKYHGNYQSQWDFDVLVARHFDDNILGFGFSKDLLEAVWRFDITLLKDRETALSFVTNLDYSWSWFERNFYGFIEYFHNDSFLQNQDSLGGGIQVELTPLLNLYTNWIGNLHENSGIFQIRSIYDWLENVQLIAWLDQPYSESIVPERTMYLRLIYYF